MSSLRAKSKNPSSPECDTTSKELQMLRGLVDDLDDFVILPFETTEITMQAELREVEHHLHHLYDKVTVLRKHLHLPPLILAPAAHPPAFQPVISQIAQAELLLEWRETLERHSKYEGSLTINFSRKVKQLNVFEYIQVNGERLDKPIEGWGMSVGPFYVHNGKSIFRIMLMLGENWSIAQESEGALRAGGRHEIRYETTVFGKKPGTVASTIARKFKVRRS